MDHLAVNKGKICITVDYAHHELKNCFVLVKCVKEGNDEVSFNETMSALSLCLKEQPPPNSLCNITATDMDAIYQIDSVSAYTILGIAVPDYLANTTTGL